MSAAAGAGRLFGLSVNELANAIAIATVDNISLTCVHAEPVSQWKGFSPGITGMRAVYAASLAKRGFTGPKGLFEGPYGPENMFAQSIPVNWEDPSLDVVKQTIMKKYYSLIHGQPALEAVLDKASNIFSFGLAAPVPVRVKGRFRSHYMSWSEQQESGLMHLSICATSSPSSRKRVCGYSRSCCP